MEPITRHIDLNIDLLHMNRGEKKIGITDGFVACMCSCPGFKFWMACSCFSQENLLAGARLALDLNTMVRRHNMAAMDDIVLFTATKPQSQADVDSQTQVTKCTKDAIDLTSLKTLCLEEVEAEMREQRLKLKRCKMAKDMKRSGGNTDRNVTDFLDRYSDLCTDYKLSDEDKMRRLPRYCDMRLGWAIETIQEWQERK